jgi:hypothetical protein
VVGSLAVKVELVEHKGRKIAFKTLLPPAAARDAAPASVARHRTTGRFVFTRKLLSVSADSDQSLPNLNYQESTTEDTFLLSASAIVQIKQQIRTSFPLAQ